jgi:DNA-binding transcriptional MerR regulator
VNNSRLSIAAVATATGLTKEVIRKWETRYGFPIPERDTLGNRVFTAQQVLRLQMIKTLMDRGMRPGKVIQLAEDDLQVLVAARHAIDDSLASGIGEELLACTLSTQPRAIREFLSSHIDRLGLSGFVRCLLPSMNAFIGSAWCSGRIGIHNEHAYTQAVKTLLRERLDRAAVTASMPRVILSTPKGEIHTLGLLMAEVILTLEGAECVALGPDLPADEIALAAEQYDADIVALSFSSAYPLRSLIAFVNELRDLLPATVAIWAGGAACNRLPRRPPGIDLMPTLDEAIDGVRAFRERASLERERVATTG